MLKVVGAYLKISFVETDGVIFRRDFGCTKKKVKAHDFPYLTVHPLIHKGGQITHISKIITQ